MSFIFKLIHFSGELNIFAILNSMLLSSAPLIINRPIDQSTLNVGVAYLLVQLKIVVWSYGLSGNESQPSANSRTWVLSLVCDHVLNLSWLPVLVKVQTFLFYILNNLCKFNPFWFMTLRFPLVHNICHRSRHLILPLT